MSKVPTKSDPRSRRRRMSRRQFLERGLAVGAAAGASGSAIGMPERRAPWMREPGAPFSNYGTPSEHERDTIRWIAANSALPGNGVAWCPLHALEGSITPNGLHFERHHNGVPRVDPQEHQLLVHGLVGRSLTFRVDDLLRYPMRSLLTFIECAGNSNAGWHREPVQSSVSTLHGLVSCSEWTGVPLSLILREAQPNAKAAWLIAEGADAFAMQISVPLTKAWDDALLALYQNGERIRPENGYPLRLILPGWEGVTQVKWLRRLKAVSQPTMARNETARYTELQPSGTANQFTFVMSAKSLITKPHTGNTLDAGGFYEISGLAWSGHGRITRVEVSTDGGNFWQEATLQEPVLPRCFTRFRYPWRWQGKPAILQSRAVDESGYQQPSRAELVRKSGHNGYYHYNAIVSWAVDSDGFLSHVYA